MWIEAGIFKECVRDATSVWDWDESHKIKLFNKPYDFHTFLWKPGIERKLDISHVQFT